MSQAVEEIVPLSRVKTRASCPKCHNPFLSRSSAPITNVGSSGAALYSFSESCNICSWSRTTENVRLEI